MLHRAVVWLSRPKGPPGLRPGKEYRLTVPLRSEVAMLSQANFRAFNSNIRELFKKPIMANNIKAIPRDLGELPRLFVLPLLFMHQPIRLLNLWELCKEHDNVPLDSAKHLRLILKIAKMQRWVYVEKNQADNYYYYYLHRSRVHEVQQMLHQREVQKKNDEQAAELAVAQRMQAVQLERETAVKESIQVVQRLIEQNVAAIRTFEPDYELPKQKEEGEQESSTV